MISSNRKAALLLPILLLLAPLFAHAQGASNSTQFAREGIFGCSRNAAALSSSVGSFSAIGGVYVPVADYATELNTATLVYQQCVLRGLVDRMSESLITALNKNILNYVTSGNGGKPMFRADPQQEKDSIGLLVALPALREVQGMNDSLSKASPQMVSTVAQGYMADRQPLKQIACPYKGDLNQVWSGEDKSPAAINALTDSRCDALFGTLYRTDYVYSRVAATEGDVDQALLASGNFYGRQNINENGNLIIESPGSLIENTTQLVVNSGYIKSMNASDVDQMVGALFAGLSTQVISGSGGLVGLDQPIGNQPSYLAQVTAESSAGLRNAASNAAIQVLNGALAVENAYNQIMTAIATKLTTTIAQLRGAENQCWGLIIQKVCATPLAADNTCTAPDVCVTTGVPPIQTCTPGPLLKVATSTAFSQPIVTASIAPLATQAVSNIQASQQALTLLNALVAGVTNTTSLDAQRLALVQLDQLVAQGRLHQQGAVTTAQGQQGAITESMNTLVSNTVQAWGDSTDVNVGWCNVNNQAVVDFWTNQWKQ